MEQKQDRVATSEVIHSHCLALPFSLQLIRGASEKGAKSPWAEQTVPLHDAVQLNSCLSRKQALFWDSYHESQKPAPLQMLSMVTLRSIPSAALNVMPSKLKGRRRAGTNTSKPSASVAHGRQSYGIKGVKDLEPAQVHCLCRILPATM